MYCLQISRQTDNQLIIISLSISVLSIGIIFNHYSLCTQPIIKQYFCCTTIVYFYKGQPSKFPQKLKEFTNDTALGLSHSYNFGFGLEVICKTYFK